MNKLALDVLKLRRPALNYVSPAICEALFSSSSFPTVVLDPLPSVKTGITGGVIRYDGGGDYVIGWNNYPGALCYSVYKLNDANDPFSEYILVAECITDPIFDPHDWVIPPDPPGTPTCYIITAITPEGETPFGVPICPFTPPEPPGTPPPTGTGCIINGSPLPDGVVDVEYSVTLLPNGPADVPQWTVFSGSLPTGLSLNINTGVIGGTPVEEGVFNFVVVLSKNGGGSCAKAFQITITANDCILDDSILPDGTVNVPYDYIFTSTNPTVSPSWVVTSGALPDGLTLFEAEGVLSGTPTVGGDFNFEISLSDEGEFLCSKQFSLFIDESCFLDNADLPDAYIGDFYVYSFTPDPSIVTPNFEFVSGTLPAGLEHDGFGTIFGVVSDQTPQTFTFTMRLLDDVTPVCEKEFTITVVGSCIAGSAALPTGEEDVPYSYQFTPENPSLPDVTWALEFFSEVPFGMAFSSGGLLDGTPTVSGDYSFTVGLYSNGDLICRKVVTLSITAPPPDCPDFATAITWGTPTEFTEGNGTLSWTPDAGLGNTFSCVATGDNFAITPIASSTGNNTGTMTYNGNGCNCKVVVTLVEPGAAFNSGYMTIESDINGQLLLANWNDADFPPGTPRPPGTYEFFFQLPDTMGVTHTITFFVQGSGIADSVTGSSYSVNFSGIITTA